METDNVTARIVVIVLGVVALVCVVGIIVLAARHIEVPTALAIIASSDMAALVGWLVPSPMKKTS